MRKKIKNETKEMVANADWANVAPDNDNNYTMAYLFPQDVNTNKVGVAKAILTCRPDSHPFPERTLLLNQPVKVGRAVAKIRAAPDNAIFDCKVLSRHHASLWYSNGHFYLQDTKSSNGTFVNSHRLSEGSKESPPYEVCSGDIVQFGVDVLENSCSVTHGCIVATLRLYLPDGKEAKASQSTIVKSPTHVEDLCVLNNIIQEAVQREQLLEAKLRSLRTLVEGCGAALEHAWRALCSEERLVARVQFLERRLAAAAAPSHPPTELQQLIDDKHQYEVNATEALRVAHEEKLKLLNELGSIKWTINSSEEECAVLREHVDRAHQDLQNLGEKKTSVEKELQESKEALDAAERQIERLKVVLDLKDDKNRKHREKAENSENGYAEDMIERLISVENLDDISSLILDNLDKSDQKESSLPDAIRDLPEYIKALLPEQILQKVGIKAKLPSHIKDLEVKLYCLKNELQKLKDVRSDDKANDNTPGQGEPHSVIESESVNKSNSEYHNSTDDDSKKLPDEEECNQNDITIQEKKEADTLNETILENSLFSDKLGAEATKEMKAKLLTEEINEITEQLDIINEDGPAQKLVILQRELSYADGQITTLFRELEDANSKASQLSCEVFQLKKNKEQLSTTNEELKVNFSKKGEEWSQLSCEVFRLKENEAQLSAENEELKVNFSKKAEECRKLEVILSQSQPDEKEKTDENESSKYKEEVTELQKKLEDVLKSEASGSDQIEKLNSTICELKKELQERPLSSELEQHKSLLESLQEKLRAREEVVADLNRQVSILAEMQVTLEDKLSKITSNMSNAKLHNHSQEVSDKILMTDLSNTEIKMETVERLKGPIVISSSLAAADMLDDDSKLLTDDPSLSSISVDLNKLTELEEELVVTKEKWALANQDKVQLTSQLQMLNDKYDQLMKRSLMETLVYVLPLAAVFIYILMYQYIS